MEGWKNPSILPSLHLTPMTPNPPPSPSPQPTDSRLAAALLSFLIPGLGQIFQGLAEKNFNRFSKGVFFLVALGGMFFYGMWLGKWQNVYLAPVAKEKPVFILGRQAPTLAGDLWTRMHYVGQFWIGIAAWPTLIHYYAPDSALSNMFGDFQRVPPKGMTLEQAEKEMNRIQVDPAMGRLWDIGWVYTVIAGVLNILVIFDAGGGPLFPPRRPNPPSGPPPQSADSH